MNEMRVDTTVAAGNGMGRKRVRMSKRAVIASGVTGFVCACAAALSLMVAVAEAAPQPPPASASSTGPEPAGLVDAKASDCFACHAIDHKVVGPAYDEVAKRYAGKGDAEVTKLVDKIIKGGAGNWGEIPMTPHPDLTPESAKAMVEWILTLQPSASTAPATTAKETHTYKTADGKSVALDFPVFVPGQEKKVTDDVFTGYQQFNGYCNRCHGDDAVGGAYAAPDLRNSLQGGMTYQQFLETVMAGREAKGMPSWAGFFTPEQARDIYEYVKARQTELVPVGRPPSTQD